MLSRQERRQDPDLPRHPMRSLPSGQAQRPDGACGDERGVLIAATHGTQLCDESNALACSEIDGMSPRCGTGTGRPGVTDLTAEAAATRVLDHQRRVDGLAQPGGGLAEPAALQPARAG